MGKDIVVDEKSINSVFRKDCLALAVFVVALWCVLVPVLMSVIGITNDPIAKGLLIAAAGVSGAALTWAIFAVFLHIRKNRDQIYKEDLENQALAEH